MNKELLIKEKVKDNNLLSTISNSNNNIQLNDSTLLSSIQFNSTIDRSSHINFLNSRNWERVLRYWKDFIKLSNQNQPLPSIIIGNDLEEIEDNNTNEQDKKENISYTLTDLNKLHEIYEKSGEKYSKNVKFKRRTYALSIGYFGIRYNGYQQQNINNTNENKKKRNKKKNNNNNKLNNDTIISSIEGDNNLTIDSTTTTTTSSNNTSSVPESTSVPDTNLESSSNPSTSTLPTSSIPQIYTVEDSLDEILLRKVIAAGRTDKGVSALSQIVSFNTYEDESIINEDIIKNLFLNHKEVKENNLTLLNIQRVSRKFHPLFLAKWRRYIYLLPINEGNIKNIYKNNKNNNKEEEIYIDIDVNFINKCFKKLEGQTLPYNGFAHRENRATGQGLSDICTLFRASARLVKFDELPSSTSTSSSMENFLSQKNIEDDDDEEGEGEEIKKNEDEKKEEELKYTDSPYTLVIELVGDRFLRRMVRNLVATSVRESVLPLSERDEEILLKICQSGRRDKASLSILGYGLGLCGVGYDEDELYDYENKNNTTEKTGSKKNDEKNLNSRRNRYNDKQNEDNIKNKHDNSNENTSQNNIENINENSPENSTESPSKRLKIEENIHDFSYRLVNSSNFSIVNHVDFETELVSFDPHLLHYPERLFEFKSVRDAKDGFTKPLSLLLQNLTHSNVGETIWDAEVILSHFLDSFADTLRLKYQNLSRPLNILELGAGQGLAGMVLSHLTQELKYKGIILLQELDEIINKNLSSYQFSSFTVLDLLSPSKSSSSSTLITNLDKFQTISSPFLAVLRAWWGNECIINSKKIFKDISEKIIKEISDSNTSSSSNSIDSEYADIILLSDVTYNRLYFDDLLESIVNMINLNKENNNNNENNNNTNENKFPKYIFLSFEQRRIDLSFIIDKITKKLLLNEPSSIIKYIIKQDQNQFYSNEFDEIKETQFAIIVFEILL